MNDWIEGMPWQGLRTFKKRLRDGILQVIVGQERVNGRGTPMRWHLSISHQHRVPSWDEIKDARYALCPDQAHMAMILPPKAEYVNVHPFTMHLFEVER